MATATTTFLRRHLILLQQQQQQQQQHVVVGCIGRLDSSSFLRSSAFSSSSSSSSLSSSSPPPPLGQQVVLEHLTNDENVPGSGSGSGAVAAPVVSVMKLNRPSAANAMGSEFLRQFQQCLSELEEEQQISSKSSRCLIVTSSLSPKVFSAGADLKERSRMTLDETETFVHELRQSFERLASLTVPSIAAVDGVAYGGGFELALCCDVIVCTPTSRFGLVETSLGIIPGAGGTQRLSRRVIGSTAKAKELIMTAAKISGDEAYRLGIAQQLAKDNNNENDDDDDDDDIGVSSSGGGAADRLAYDMAWKIASNGPVAIKSAKYAIDCGWFAGAGSNSSMEEALDIERQAYRRVLHTKDRVEGINAFLEKRKPKYKGE